MQATYTKVSRVKGQHIVLLIGLNILLMSIAGFLTLSLDATLTSRMGGVLLAFFISIFIVLKTTNMSGFERVLKYGSGYLLYLLMAIIMIGFSLAISTMLAPCLLISIGVLYYGKDLVELLKFPMSSDQ